MLRRVATISILLLLLFIIPAYASYSDIYVVSINHTTHTTYGFAYPITYEFLMDKKQSNVSVYYKYDICDKWIKLVNESNHSYNGVYCYRVSGKKIYVSVGFKTLNSDYILLKFMANGKPLDVRYIKMTKYYDNRSSVVTASADDWCYGENTYFIKCCNCFIKHHLYLTVAVITSKAPWATIQTYAKTRYIEIASHSRSHTPLPYSNYVSEVLGSKEDILTHLHLFWWYNISGHQYVLTWIEPWGECNAKVRHLLSVGKYLVDRKCRVKNFNTFAGWDKKYHLFKRVGFTIAMQNVDVDWSTTNLTELNNYFINVTKHHEIYHLMMHPYLVNWTKGSYAWKHLDFIANRPNIWYVTLGMLYLYHYGTISGKIHVHPFRSLAILANKYRSFFGNMCFRVQIIHSIKIKKFIVFVNNHTYVDVPNPDNVSCKIPLILPGKYTIRYVLVFPNNKTLCRKVTIYNYDLYPLLYENNTVNKSGYVIAATSISYFTRFRVIPNNTIEVYPIQFSLCPINNTYLYSYIYSTKPTKVYVVLPKPINASVWLNGKKYCVVHSKELVTNISIVLPPGENILKITTISKKQSTNLLVLISLVVAISASVLVTAAIWYRIHKGCLNITQGKYFKKLK